MILFKRQIKKIGQTLTDTAKVSSRELSRSLKTARTNVRKVKYVQKRKELLAQLGRELYDTYKMGIPESMIPYFKETEIQEIIAELESLDSEIQKHKQEP